MHRQSRPTFDRSDAVLDCLLHFSNARTSIWRTRSREMPNSDDQVLERDRIVS
jgi:hypothetical protein